MRRRKVPKPFTISIGRGQQLVGAAVDHAQPAFDATPLFEPLFPFMNLLAICWVECCGIEAFTFERGWIGRAVVRYAQSHGNVAVDALVLASRLGSIAVAASEESVVTIGQFGGARLTRDLAAALLDHISATVDEAIASGAVGDGWSVSRGGRGPMHLRR